MIGAYAVGHHGYPRLTGDLDVWVARSASNADRLVRVLEEFGFSPESDAQAPFTVEEQVIRIGNSPFRIKVLTSISGVEFADCYQRKATSTIDGIEVPIISLADLRTNKAASGRGKDLVDLEHFPPAPPNVKPTGHTPN